MQDQRAYLEDGKGSVNVPETFVEQQWVHTLTFHFMLYWFSLSFIFFPFLSRYWPVKELPDWLEQGRNLRRYSGCLGNIIKFSPKFTAVSQKVQIVRFLFTD